MKKNVITLVNYEVPCKEMALNTIYSIPSPGKELDIEWFTARKIPSIYQKVIVKVIVGDPTNYDTDTTINLYGSEIIIITRKGKHKVIAFPFEEFNNLISSIDKVVNSNGTCLNLKEDDVEILNSVIGNSIETKKQINFIVEHLEEDEDEYI